MAIFLRDLSRYWATFLYIFIVFQFFLAVRSFVLHLCFIPGYLSSLLKLNVVPSKFQLNEAVDADAILLENISDFVQEQANCPTFSRQLSSGVSIFVNDSFCLSHKVLSSTVGITGFCDASLAGFQFDLELSQAKEIIETSQSPYIAIVSFPAFYHQAICYTVLR